MSIHPNHGSRPVADEPARTPCPCGDSYCSDRMPKNQDRSGCCQYCGTYDCDVCGWADPTTPEANR